ncbi:hypothetical protein C7446_2812 [Kushneria sinocarnis]|uniref:Uncharacterized protein n=1 Tax=Kushneria sinocarnis TaxID=595502 RepID=A0A420WU38_9GAMM|nr:hypothetical protein [Kushneria sinocarnis]RKQ96951.1 hypothetical protein C7446_2812 [Kushneria sinocarnis]
MRDAWILLLLGVLAGMSGCAAYRTQDPLAFAGSQVLPASCRQPHPGSRLQQVSAAAGALESMGYQVRNTDADLGLVTAERRTSMPGLGAVDEPYVTGWGGRYRHGFGFGAGFGGYHSPWGVFEGDPVRLERVSVAPVDETAGTAADPALAVTREVSVVMPDGYVRYRDLELPEDFCQRLHQSIDEQLQTAHHTVEPAT